MLSFSLRNNNSAMKLHLRCLLKKKNNKNCMILHCKNAEMTILCMILHCKNAEMTILLSFLHFYSVKSYNFCYFFSPIQICFRLNKKKFFSNFYFFPSCDLNILRKKIHTPSIKKIRPKQLSFTCNCPA